MCGRFVLMSPGSLVAEQFKLSQEPVLEPRYNIAPSQPVAVIRQDTESGSRELAMLRSGLVPFWSKDLKIGYVDWRRREFDQAGVQLRPISLVGGKADGTMQRKFASDRAAPIVLLHAHFGGETRH